MTGQDIIDRLLLRLQDLGDLTAAHKLDYVNEANDYIYSVASDLDPDRYTSSQSYTPSASPVTSTLPTDLLSFKSTNQGFFTVSGDNYYPLREIDRGSLLRGFTLEGDNVILKALSGETVELKYTPETTRLTIISDNVFLADKWIMLYVHYIEASYSGSELGSGGFDESAAGQRFVNELSVFKNKFRRTNKIIKISV